jgi:hypothetical protein
MLAQLNRGESRHRLARECFHGQRGEFPAAVPRGSTWRQPAIPFRYVGIPAPGQREAVHWDESGKPGRLGKVLSQHEQGLLLFDEIEKAHRLIWDLILQLLDAARITLGDHRSYDLSGFYVVCTSNIGSQQLLRPTRLPFTTLERAVISELQKFFRPELIGRFDEKLVFKPLSPDTHPEIALLAITEELALCPPNRGEQPEGVSPSRTCATRARLYLELARTLS